MKLAFRLYRRGGVYYCQHNQTGRQESLRTSDAGQAARLLHARNEASRMAGLNLAIARAYMVAADPRMPERTWKEVIDFMCDTHNGGATGDRLITASKDKALASLWTMRVVETRPDHLLETLHKGTVSTNVFFRRVYNFALDMGWLPASILPKKKWPKIVYGDKRGITEEEHRRIVERETNQERRDYYELLWHTGGSQTDVASIHAEDIDWTERIIFYCRKKNKEHAMPRFGEEAAAVLRRRPNLGPLFPYLITVREADRATEFKQRCNGLGIKGITLHSYRYAWAERAAKVGYPERHAQSNLGHGSKAFARAYAKKAKVITPPLEDYEKACRGGKVILFPRDLDAEGQRLQAALGESGTSAPSTVPAI
jgi:integrase